MRCPIEENVPSFLLQSFLDNWVSSLKDWTLYLAAGIEAGAGIIIGLAAIEAIARALFVYFRRSVPENAKEAIRLRLGRWLSLALEFEVAADILRTAVAPTWDDIGKLAAIVVLRTVL